MFPRTIKKKAAGSAFGGVEGDLLSSQERVALSVSHGAKDLQAVHPNIVIPPNDPSIAKAFSQRKYAGILKTPDVLAAPGNPEEFLKLLESDKAIVVHPKTSSDEDILGCPATS